jgi:hypothetical protein
MTYVESTTLVEDNLRSWRSLDAPGGPRNRLCSWRTLESTTDFGNDYAPGGLWNRLRSWRTSETTTLREDFGIDYAPGGLRSRLCFWRTLESTTLVEDFGIDYARGGLRSRLRSWRTWNRLRCPSRCFPSSTLPLAVRTPLDAFGCPTPQCSVPPRV